MECLSNARPLGYRCAMAPIRIPSDTVSSLGRAAHDAGLAALLGGEGLRGVAEAFADRAYNPDGTLVSRREPGAVLHDEDAVAANMVRLATEGTIVARDGSTIKTSAESICLHGDTAGAVSMAAAVRRKLEAAGVDIRSFV